MKISDIVIVANSPGELSALVKPVIETAAEQIKDKRIILVLTPCQYTSGWEHEYIRTIRGIDKVISAEEFKSWILLNRKPDFVFNSKGLVVYLGGDLAYPILIAKKLKYQAFAYVQDRIGWIKSYKRFFVPDEETKAKFAKHSDIVTKFTVVGNLMVDSISHLPKWSPEKNRITFMPGSRAWQIKHTTPIYQKIIQELQYLNSNLKFQIVSSPFEPAIEIPGTTKIHFEDTINSELVITIPGTNTARLASLGIPMLVIFPLDDPDVIPLEGIPHLIGKIPYFGSKFKRFLADTLNKKVKFFALPNIKAKEEIVPEIRGIIKPEQIAAEAMKLLQNLPKRQTMSQKLLSCMGNAGAAQKIVEEICEAILSPIK
ncbi:MAG: hypothetical protein WC890_00120 [Candidatus Margulisiibacteriota bacterium]